MGVGALKEDDLDGDVGGCWEEDGGVAGGLGCCSVDVGWGEDGGGGGLVDGAEDVEGGLTAELEETGGGVRGFAVEVGGAELGAYCSALEYVSIYAVFKAPRVA